MRKNAVLDLAPPTLQNSGIFHDNTRSSTLMVCRRNHGDPSSLYRTYDALQVLQKQEAQLMLTTGSTRLLAVSRARAISDGTLT